MIFIALIFFYQIINKTQGGKILSGHRGSSVVMVNPKMLHLTTMKGASGITGEF